MLGNGGGSEFPTASIGHVGLDCSFYRHPRLRRFERSGLCEWRRFLVGKRLVYLCSHGPGEGLKVGSSFVHGYRDIEEIMAKRGIQVTYETVREWCHKFGSLLRCPVEKEASSVRNEVAPRRSVY